MPIRRLPPLLVNQIAAGEVIERPASVVKELVENAIDAGATRIDVAIEQGGCELIRISDNGCGIPLEELTLAVAAHATSKIQSADDLDAIATLGFRGEALASIASVSRLAIVSRTAHAASAGLIEMEGDQAPDPRPAAGPIGTTVTVRNLFFNTPARRKFLRAEVTETSRVVEIVENLALAHPAVSFVMAAEGKTRFEWPADQNPRERALTVLGRELAGELLEFASSSPGLSMWGLAGKPSIARGTAKHQRVFLNGRVILDRTINHAIKEAYRGLIEPTRSPTVALFLTLDPSQVDVNVHPSKAEVRFRNSAAIHGAVLSNVRDALRRADLTPAVRLESSLSLPLPAFRPPNLLNSSQNWGNEKQVEGGEGGGGGAVREFVEYFQRLDPRQQGFVYSEVKQALAEQSPELLAQDMTSHADSFSAAGSTMAASGQNVADILQIHSSYIVTQDEHGLVIIDQHALHERVMFEKLKARLGEGNLESQRLLMPATIEVDRSQAAMLEELKPLLARIGIDAEAIGPAAVAVHSFTTLLFERGVDPVQFMTELFDKAASRGVNTDPEAALHETLDMMACKAAVKAGDHLSPTELTELLAHRHTIERASNCPHGRPTTLRLSLKELNKQFGRS